MIYNILSEISIEHAQQMWRNLITRFSRNLITKVQDRTNTTTRRTTAIFNHYTARALISVIHTHCIRQDIPATATLFQHAKLRQALFILYIL